MSPTEKLEVKPQSTAADQTNALLCMGPAAPGRVERMRHANRLAPNDPQEIIDVRVGSLQFSSRLPLPTPRFKARISQPTAAAHTQYEGESHDVDENKGP